MLRKMIIGLTDQFLPSRKQPWLIASRCLVLTVMRMIRGAFIITMVLLFSSCEGGMFEKADPYDQTGKVDTVAVYWPAMDYDTLKASIKDRITFPGKDTIYYLPSDRDLTLKFEFSGKMKEYMKHGKMIVRPFDSSVYVKRIDDHSFNLKINRPTDDWTVGMYYEYVFEEPYHFSYIFDGKTYRSKPNDTSMLFVRWQMTKPRDPWDYY